jgi:hypothetical protein
MILSFEQTQQLISHFGITATLYAIENICAHGFQNDIIFWSCAKIDQSSYKA